MNNVTLTTENQALLINALTGVEDLNINSNNDRYQYLIKTLNFDQCNEGWNYFRNGDDWECYVNILNIYIQF